MDIATMDRLLALTGFALTLWQLHRTRTAAQAACVSSQQAVNAVMRLYAATRMYDIAGRSRELFRVLWLKNFEAAADTAFELRNLIARYRHDEQSRAMVSAEAWALAADDVERVHEAIIGLVWDPQYNEPHWKALIKEVGRLHLLFTKFAAAAESSGASHVDR